ncbi:MAG: winged helix-turn-helix transcriptional regulator [Ruminococcaceae bacterium]|nr:winged helix-turn-helix transcriptional regulator [Oscillospiraceae bacterium]
MKPSPAFKSQFAQSYALFEAMDRLRHVWTSFAPPPPLRRSDMMILGPVLEACKHQREPLTTSKLAHITHQSMPGVSQKLNGLEEQGYLRRVGDKTDRRVIRVELTEKGERVTTETMREYFSRMEQALESLGDEKIQTLMALMYQLSDALERANLADADATPPPKSPERS